MLIVANKADMPTSDENIKRLEEKYGNVIPASAESELSPYKSLRSRVNKLFPW